MNYLIIDDQWKELLRLILKGGSDVSPRGKLTRELPQRNFSFSMMSPVLINQARKLSYQFMAAEAHWIVSGSDRVADIAPWNKHIAQFSDDGERFFGAYGPKVVGQLPYVIDKLTSDPDSRQAGLTLWRENPPATKDYPCTIAMFFNIRRRGGLAGKGRFGELNMHVFMRSSDVWLGLPYDSFNFSCVAFDVCAKLNASGAFKGEVVVPGRCYITAASSHLYEEQWAAVEGCLKEPTQDYPALVPVEWYLKPGRLLEALADLRDTKAGNPLRFWETPRQENQYED